MMRIIGLAFGWHLVHEERVRAEYETAKACEDHNRRANRAEGLVERLRVELEQRTERHRQEHALILARYDALLEHLTRVVSLAPPAPLIIHGEIPDPPSVSAADARVAVALRDREAAPLKRPLRPGEDE